MEFLCKKTGHFISTDCAHVEKTGTCSVMEYCKKLKLRTYLETEQHDEKVIHKYNFESRAAREHFLPMLGICLSCYKRNKQK